MRAVLEAGSRKREINEHRAGGAPTHEDKPGMLPGPVEGMNTSSKLGIPVEKPSSCHPPILFPITTEP